MSCVIRAAWRGLAMAMPKTPGVEYLARLTCACGAVAEVEMYARCVGASWSGCSGDVEYEHDFSDGWLGGFGDKRPECPACVEKNY